MIEKIQQGRSIIMGFAILWVIVFHYQFLYGTPFVVFVNKGFLGVDLFIALSAFGLCFSLLKESNYKKYLKKRILRIIPTWWIIITVMLLINIALGKDNHPHTLFQYICYYSGLGWWFYYDQSYGIYYYEWYIPTILAFYIFIPFIYKQSNRVLIWMVIFSAIIGFILSYFHLAENLQLSYFRVPTLIYGVILYRCYEMTKQGRITKSYQYSLYGSSIIGFISVLMNSLGIIELKHGMLIYSFMLSIPLFCYLIVFLFDTIRLTRIMSFVGGITLELYLLHIYNIPLNATMRIIDNKTIAICITVVLLIGIAYLVQNTISLTMKCLKKTR